MAKALSSWYLNDSSLIPLQRDWRPPNDLIYFKGKPHIIRDFKKADSFVRELDKLLRACGIAGSLMVILEKKVKGRPQKLGIHLGSPNTNKRSVEATFQSEGSDTLFSLHLLAPHGMDPIEFHKLLDHAKKTTRDQPRTEAAMIAPANDVPLLLPLSGDDIELFLREILPSATNAGVVTKQICIETLSELGRKDCEADLANLLEGSYMETVKGGKSVLRINKDRLARLREEPESKSSAEQLDRAMSPEPAKASEPPTSPVDLLAEVEQLSRIVERAAELRAKLPDLQREASELEQSVKVATARLDAIKSEVAGAMTVLSDPDLERAERMLDTLRQRLRV
jgi:hypothetical protein